MAKCAVICYARVRKNVLKAGHSLKRAVRKSSMIGVTRSWKNTLKLNLIPYSQIWAMLPANTPLKRDGGKMESTAK